ncbi:MAG TPA: hypothetical protein ENJ82_07040 [Bacteroidetes bacterium]|nr:hypothetical protein [Bacteroidota bacterium]
MKATDFTNHSDVLAILQDLKQHFANDPLIISDIIDNAGRQYVDLVQEGGGVWGVALLGYTYILEEMGIRFASMAGTSAGAINTLLLAAAAEPAENRTKKVLAEMANKNLFDFVDGNWFSRQTISAMVREEPKLLLLFRLLFNLRRIFKRLGLNPGNAFKEWLSTTIHSYGVQTTADLKAKMNSFPENVYHRITGKSDPDLVKAGVAFIAAEIETGSKVRFPYAASLFFPNSDQANPAEFVRASMSIPLFFEPVIIPKAALPANSDAAWRQLGHLGKAPSRAILVDGGILSNFPIDVFHRQGHIPRRPTLGVKLSPRSKKRNAKKKAAVRLKLFSFLGGNFSAARHLRDQEFIFSHPDYQYLVSEIDVGNHKWMNFALEDSGKLDLFLRGAQAAKSFLLSFDWEAYKIRRAELLWEDIQVRRAGIENATGKVGEVLRKAMATRAIPLNDSQEKVLLQRIQHIEPSAAPFSILWIDDQSDRNKRESSLIQELGDQVKITFVESSELAESLLLQNEYQLIISDIRRGDQPNEGLLCHQRILAAGTAVPIIFYINNYDPKKGVPSHAFGITNSPEELLHLVMDIMSRKGHIRI